MYRIKNLRLRSTGKFYSEILTFWLRLEPLSKSSQRVVVAAFYRRGRLYSGISRIKKGGAAIAVSIKVCRLVTREGIQLGPLARRPPLSTFYTLYQGFIERHGKDPLQIWNPSGSQTMRNASAAVDATQGSAPQFSQIRCCIPRRLQRVQRVLLRRNQKDPTKPNIKEQSGDARPPLLFGCTQLKLVTASTLKTLRLSTTVASKVKEALHSGSQAVNRCVALPVQYQTIQIRTDHKEVRQS